MQRRKNPDRDDKKKHGEELKKTDVNKLPLNIDHKHLPMCLECRTKKKKKERKRDRKERKWLQLRYGLGARFIRHLSPNLRLENC
jgi:hypothetical protein